MHTLQEELFEKLKYEDLDDTQKELADILGMETYKIFIRNYSGESLQVHTVRSVLSPVIRRAIKEEFDGYNFKALARKYGYSERNIRVILKS